MGHTCRAASASRPLREPDRQRREIIWGPCSAMCGCGGQGTGREATAEIGPSIKPACCQGWDLHHDGLSSSLVCRAFRELEGRASPEMNGRFHSRTPPRTTSWTTPWTTCWTTPLDPWRVRGGTARGGDRTVDSPITSHLHAVAWHVCVPNALAMVEDYLVDLEIDCTVWSWASFHRCLPNIVPQCWICVSLGQHPRMPQVFDIRG